MKWLVEIVQSQDLVSWLGVAAEVAIALVIYWELEETRRAGFLSEAFDPRSYQSKTDIFRAFFATAGDSLQERSRRFCQSLWQDSGLRQKCDIQLASFNKLGYIFRPRRFGKDPMMEWFPQSAISFWVILKPYILERQTRAGKWWARAYLKFVLACVQFVLKESESGIRMFDPDGNQPNIDISRGDLKSTQRELEGLTA